MPSAVRADKGWNQTIVRTERGDELMELAQKKRVLEFRDVPEVNLERLKKASVNKKRNGVRNIVALTGGKGDLSYLTPSAELFAGLID